MIEASTRLLRKGLPSRPEIVSSHKGPCLTLGFEAGRLRAREGGSREIDILARRVGVSGGAAARRRRHVGGLPAETISRVRAVVSLARR